MQSINNIDPEHYQDKYEEDLICMADEEVLYERFMLGDKIDTDKFLHTSTVYEKVSTDDSSMYDYIVEVIESKTKEKCSKKGFNFHHIGTENFCYQVEQCLPIIEW